MNLWSLFSVICGFEVIGDRVRLYVNSPKPAPNFDRVRGERSCLFYLFAGDDATAIIDWLNKHRAWQVLRVPPPFTTKLGASALLAAADWHAGEGSALCLLAHTRVIADDAHRERLRREVRHLLSMVLENPVRDGEFETLRTLEDAINAAPLGVELATSAEVVNEFFGATD
jgi:hypothetical protein